MRLSFTEDGKVITGEALTQRVQESVERRAGYVAEATKEGYEIGKALFVGTWRGFSNVFSKQTNSRIAELEAKLEELTKKIQ